MRLLIGWARPRSFGWNRLMVGPSSTQERLTTRFATFASDSSALAMALLRMALRYHAPRRLLNYSDVRAWSTGSPRTMSATSRAFLGAIRAKRCEAVYAMTWSCQDR